jgi:hypothetical protein
VSISNLEYLSNFHSFIILIFIRKKGEKTSEKKNSKNLEDDKETKIIEENAEEENEHEFEYVIIKKYYY